MIEDSDIARAMVFVRRHPISKAQFARDAHMGKNKAARILEVMEHRGIVKRAFFGVQGWRYALPAVAEAANAKEVAAQERLWRRREICARYRAKKAGCPVDDREDVDTWPVNRVFRSANDAPPIAKRGPASVWELAA